jgi:23S rRNA pseudouridine2605 synthase
VVTELGTKVDPRGAAISVDGKPLRAQRPRYVLLNKPGGYITTTDDERGRRTVMDLVPSKERIYPVGRLDRDTEGLLLLTNDGEVAHRVMHPRHELAKEYHVVTLSRPSDATARRVRDGVTIEGRRVVPDEFRILRETREGIVLKLVIHEGMYHAVRRMMDAVGIPVKALRRVRLGPLTIAGIPLGGWRELSEGERASLFEALRLARAESGDDLDGRALRPGPLRGGPTRGNAPSPGTQPETRAAEGGAGAERSPTRRVAAPRGRPKSRDDSKPPARSSAGKAPPAGPATTRARGGRGVAGDARHGSGPPRQRAKQPWRAGGNERESAVDADGSRRPSRQGQESHQGKPRDDHKGRRRSAHDDGDRQRRSDDASKGKTGGRGQRATPRRSGGGGTNRRPARGSGPRRRGPNSERSDGGRGPTEGPDER